MSPLVCVNAKKKRRRSRSIDFHFYHRETKIIAIYRNRVAQSDDPPRNELRIHWQGGIHTRLTVARNPPGKHGRRTSGDVIQLIRELSKVCDDRTIAAVLNRLGHRTGAGNTWQSSRIADVRHQYQIPNFSAGDQWVTMSQAAKELGVSSTVILSLIDERVLPAQQVVACAPWIIERVHLTRPVVREHVEAVHKGKRRPSTSSDQREFPWKINDIDEV